MFQSSFMFINNEQLMKVANDLGKKQTIEVSRKITIWYKNVADGPFEKFVLLCRAWS